MNVKPMRAATAVLIFLMPLLLSCRTNQPPEPVKVRVGYFPNLTHAPAIVAVESGLIAQALGSRAKLDTRLFNAGPEVVEALFAEALDIAYIGPNPAINAFIKSDGAAIRIISGATLGGAALVVQQAITSPAQLKGAKLATPQLGNTQDVALRSWLRSQGLHTSLEGGGDVGILPQPNAQSLETFRARQIAGAWLPEPWVTRLVLEAGAHVLVDERTLWPNGKFVTTHVVARRAFLQEHPQLVAAVLGAHVHAIDLLNADTPRAQRIVNEALAKYTGKPLAPEVIGHAWSNLTFTVDPAADSLLRSAKEAASVGLLDAASLAGIYDLGPLNQLLKSLGRREVNP